MSLIWPIPKPPLSSYLYYGYRLAALSRLTEHLPWLDSEFVQLIGDRRKDGQVRLDFLGTYTFPGCFERTVSASECGPYAIDLHRYIEEQLDLGRYVLLTLDEYYLRNKISYQREHAVGLTMIYGCDRERQVYMCLGYNRELIFAPWECSYDEAAEAALVCDSVMTVLRIDPPGETVFSLPVFRRYVWDYISPSHTAPDERRGIEAYDLFDPEAYAAQDFRTFQVMHEHKAFMQSRLARIHDRYPLPDFESIYGQWQDIVKHTERLKLINMRNSLLKDARHARSGALMIQELKRKERDVLERLYEQLGRHESEEEAEPAFWPAMHEGGAALYRGETCGLAPWGKLGVLSSAGERACWTYRSSDPTVASVDPAGTATGHRAGSAVIEAIEERDGRYTVIAAVQVEIADHA